MDDNNLTEKADQNEITCKNCSAKLTFKPGTHSLNCEFCGTLNEIEVDEEKRREANEEIDYEKFIRNQVNLAPKLEVSTIRCDSCGATTTFDPKIVSEQCDFCGSPLAVKTCATSSVIVPKALLPFKVEKNAGKELFEKWLKSLWFAPNALKKYARAGRLSGVYIPYWTYDSDTETNYRGERGIDYEESYTDSDGETQTRTKTRWSSVYGRVQDIFDDILVVASKSLPIKYVDALEPWSLNQLVPFDVKFLSGFKAERYQVDLKDGFDTAKVKMDVTIRNSIRRDIGGDHQRISSTDTSYNDVTFKHILLPIWISAYKFNKKTFRFMINGDTGEVKGERPWSWVKITFTILIVVAIIAAIVYYANQSS